MLSNASNGLNEHFDQLCLLYLWLVVDTAEMNLKLTRLLASVTDCGIHMVILEILGWSFKYLYSVCGLSVNKGGNECFDSVCFC